MVPVRTTSPGGRVADEARADEHDAALAGAARLHAAGDSAAALEILPDLVAARPDHLDTRLLLARCLAAVGAPAVARAAAEAAVEVDPSSWQAHVLVARAVGASDPSAAVAAAERAVALAPAEPEAHRALAEATSTGGVPATDVLLDPTRPDPTERSRTVTPTLPRSLQGVLPDTGQVGSHPANPPSGDVDRRREPVLPKALGGSGLDGSPLGAADEPDAHDRIGGGRMAFRIVGLVGWLLIGFRFGVQGIGGPIGLLLFAAVVAGVAYGASRVTR
jgi:tetratricopeptide (TPR) repeat protein